LHAVKIENCQALMGILPNKVYFWFACSDALIGKGNNKIWGCSSVG
jgi:hypothetical protein